MNLIEVKQKKRKQVEILSTPEVQVDIKILSPERQGFITKLV